MRGPATSALRAPAIRRLLLAAGVLAVAWAGLRFARALPDAATRSSHGFGCTYALGRMLHDGEDLAGSYDPVRLAAVMARFTPGVTDININPPPLAVVFLPFASLEYRPARVVWTVLNLLLLAGVVGLLAREAALPAGWALGLVGVVLVFQPLAADFHLGQVYVPLLALLTGAWIGFRHRRDDLLGVCLGLALVLKLAGLPLLPLLVVERRWRALGATALTAAVVALATLPLVGVAAWRADLPLLLAHPSRPERAVTAYQTVASAAHHLLSRSDGVSPAPLLDAPGLAALVTWLGSAALVAGGLLAATRRPGDDGAFAALIVAGVLASPLSLDYTYTLLLLPAAVALARVRASGGRLAWVVLIAALVLLAADLPYRSPRLAAGAWALLAYPKLAGALALWGLLLLPPPDAGKARVAAAVGAA